MTWNYRLFKFTESGYAHYEICEVFYTKSGKVHGWSTRHAVLAQSKNGIKWQLRMMRLALSKPTLEEKTVRGKQKLMEVDAC